MIHVIGAPTLYDALSALSEKIKTAERNRQKSLVFCEDRLTLLTERAVIAAAGGATVLTDVTTFARYLSGERRVLSKQGSVVALTAIIEAQREKLECFRGASAQAVYETLAQLLSSRVDEEMLLAGANEADGVLKRKLNDLSLLLTEYKKFLREHDYVDENGYLALLPEAIAAGDLRDTNVFFFAFPSFTAQAREGIRAAIANADSVTGVFVAGKEELYTNEGARIFRTVAEQLAPVQSEMVKSTQCAESLAITRGLFSPEKLSASPTPTDKIRIFTADDENDELEKICALIKAHVRAGKRYRDIAVLLDGVDGAYVGRAFEKYRIPYYTDRKRAFSQHPFCAFVLSVLNGAADGVLPETADAILSSVYFGGGDAYRNYLLRYGCYRGAYKRAIKDAVPADEREALEACRSRLEAIMSLMPRKGTGRAFAEGVRALRAFVNEERVTENLAQAFDGAEREFLERNLLDGVLGEIEVVAGETVRTAREFSVMLENGLKALSVSMIPERCDAVFVGDATESRITRVGVLFCAQMTDALPHVSTDTAVISDGEIGRLRDLSMEIEPAIAVVNARSRESLALNVAAFSDMLYLSYPAKKGGKEQLKGEAVSYLERLFKIRPVTDFFPLNCCEEVPARLALYALKDAFEEGKLLSERRYSSLYAALSEGGMSLEEPVVAAKDAGALWFAGDVSPTLLENYFECPYRGFVSRCLKLRERQEGSMPATDAGNFVHAVLESVTKRFAETATEDACRALARETALGLLESPLYNRLADTREGVYGGKRLVEESVEATVAAYRQLAVSGFSVYKTEAEISIPSLHLRGKSDRIDVAEEYIRIFDYKTGSIDDKPLSYYTGRKLQLQLYLLSCIGGASVHKAAGAFYFPAQEVFARPSENRYRLSGFFSTDDRALSLMDTARKEGEKSSYFDGGGRTEKGMKQEDFNDFLAYSLLVAQRAEDEMRRGNVAPSPYENACSKCKMGGMCGFVGTPRKIPSVGCAQIVKIVRAERGEI